MVNGIHYRWQMSAMTQVALWWLREEDRLALVQLQRVAAENAIQLLRLRAQTVRGTPRYKL